MDVNYLAQIQRGIDYIEAQLDESIVIAQVARVAGISRWHFQRIFKALVGETLKVYIRARRLARASERLLASEMRILDIALLAGFESQESFTRAFKAAFGLTPYRFRKLGRKRLFLQKVQIDEAYLAHIQHKVSPVPVIRERAAMTLVGLRTLFYGVDSDKNNVAAKLPALWEAFLPRLSEIADVVPGICYGVIRQEEEGEERLEYHAAIEVRTTVDVLPKGMVQIEIPGVTYAHFEHRGSVQGLDHTVNYIYATWLARSGFRHSYGVDLEIYGPDYHPTSETSVIHYAIPLSQTVLSS